MGTGCVADDQETIIKEKNQIEQSALNVHSLLEILHSIDLLLSVFSNPVPVYWHYGRDSLL